MNCNGCVQKIKKALSGVNGIYDLYIDFPQQKITIIGWTDPEKIVKAIKKTRKMATICNSEPIESPSQPEEPSSQPTEPNPEENAQAHEATQPVEIPPTQAGTLEEPPKDTPPPEQPPPEAIPSPTLAENNLNQQSPKTPRTKDLGEVHVIHHNPPDYGNRFGSGHNYVGHWGDRYRYHHSPAFLEGPPQPVFVTHSYNTYRPSPYVTEYEYVRSPPRLTHYNRMEHYSGDYPNGNGNITSMFSDENPNACRIV
ncbi:Copper transport protein CCH [Spatholobus suberectus]|nr:Copper transport protein CCH [Spatholobus suberectus]